MLSVDSYKDLIELENALSVMLSSKPSKSQQCDTDRSVKNDAFRSNMKHLT